MTRVLFLVESADATRVGVALLFVAIALVAFVAGVIVGLAIRN